MARPRKPKENWCPMDGTTHEGFCVDNKATIRVKSKKCDHKEFCTKLRQELERKQQDESRDLH